MVVSKSKLLRILSGFEYPHGWRLHNLSGRTSLLLKYKCAFFTSKSIFFTSLCADCPFSCRCASLWKFIPVSYLCTKISQSLPTSGLNGSSCLSLSSYVRCSKSLIILMAFFWPPAVCPLAKGTQIWTQHLVTSHQGKLEGKGHLTQCADDSTFPMHSRTLLAFFASGAHCQLIPAGCLPRPPRPFLPDYFTIVWPQPGVMHGQDLTFPFLELQVVPVTHFSSLLMSLWTAVQPSGVSATSSIFCHLQSCWKHVVSHHPGD